MATSSSPIQSSSQNSNFASPPQIRPLLPSPKTASSTLTYLHTTYPIVICVFFLFLFIRRGIVSANDNSNVNQDGMGSVSFGPGGKPLPKRTWTGLRRRKRRSEKVDDDASPTPRGLRIFYKWLCAAPMLTFLANMIATLCRVVVEWDKRWWCGQAYVIYVVGSFFVFSLVMISIWDSKTAPHALHQSTWLLAGVMEVAQLVLYIAKHESTRGLGKWYSIDMAIFVIRLVLLFGLFGLHMLFERSRKHSTREYGTSNETASLLGSQRPGNGHPNGSPHGYANGRANGRTSVTATDAGDGRVYGAVESSAKRNDEEDTPGWVRPKEAPTRNWWEYLRGYAVFFPYLWPSQNRRLQLIVVLCFILVLAQRAFNVLVPYQVGVIVKELSGQFGEKSIPWKGICFYILFRLMQGSTGLIGCLRQMLWIPVGQYCYRELTVASFEHVHSLSLDFHLGKKTGEVISALGKGRSINTFLEQMTFQVVPMIIDLFVAVIYFLTVFDAYYALTVTTVTFWYIYATIRLAAKRAKSRREMTNRDREQDAVKNDSLQSYETVKYFNAENYEFQRYRDAVVSYQEADWDVSFQLQELNITQQFIFMVALIVVSFIASYQVYTDQIEVGKFVSLLTYMAQLQSPLNYFGTFYKVIQGSMISAERLLELFKERPTVVDEPHAKKLEECEGEIRFDNVQFAYDKRKDALQGLSFHCPPGTTTALVGESGGGKSTVFRLLFRFYNAQAGKIAVDGHDVRDITIDSVRSHIGVVPQDTVLFNESIMYNLKYANRSATDEQVYEACRAASIHDRIMSFPDGYGTKVGERGLRLSGGEKQRVAIARTILKNPRIILLDEATAALDTETEQNIQEALTTLSEGRTMLVIAHRLSTIYRADQIIVLHKGQVTETGSHAELLRKKGRYASMWKKQIRAQEAATQARKLNNKADRLRRESKDGRERRSGVGVDDADGHEQTSSSSNSSDGEMGSKEGQQHHPLTPVVPIWVAPPSSSASSPEREFRSERERERGPGESLHRNESCLTIGESEGEEEI